MSGPWEDLLHVDEHSASRLLSGCHSTPHDILGCHETSSSAEPGVVLRVMHPEAVAAHATIDGKRYPLDLIGPPGLFGAFLPYLRLPLHPQITFGFADGAHWQVTDPYGFWPTLGDHDLHLFGEGKHFEIWRVLGARAREHDGHTGTAFAVWAPNAAAVSVVCDANDWDGRLWPMRAMGSSGVYELFVPGVGARTRYQFDIRTTSGEVLRKSDPYAEAADHPPERASIVTEETTYVWGDGEHMTARGRRDLGRSPMNVYEAHLGSFRRHADGRVLNYRELADALIPHLQRFGFTHLELLPICEHPFDGSWGYQVTGFYAPTSRFGTSDDFRFLVDRCHQSGIEVIIDWVPAHFPKDDFALARFDGTPLYEHADPRQAEHPDWGTLIFNYGRNEVANFLIGSALYFLQEFHIDGLRVDAVASMLYLDYSRAEGDWVPNAHGGRENLEAIAFLRHLNAVIAERTTGCYSIAEESTSWTGVTSSVQSGGLGFAFKWNMGWMHDSLQYFSRDPVHRRFHQNDLTFASLYEHTERFLMPLSHDEVVHGKRALPAKMPGDPWQRLANLRALLTYQYTRPGKKLVFMGTEFAADEEWDHRAALPWPHAEDRERQDFMLFFAALGQLYLRFPALHASDADEGGFRFIDTSDHGQSVLSYLRARGDEQLLVVLNLTPAPRPNYRIGAPKPGRFQLVFNSDERSFGGSDLQATTDATTQAQPMHGCEQSIVLDLPPLAVVVLEYQEAEELVRARALGIAEHYHTIDGVRHATSDVTRKALMEALGEPVEEGSPMRPEVELPVYSVDEMLGGRRALGVWTQLYALHSGSSWGVGDLGDLKALLDWAAEVGLDFIGLNPLHAMDPAAQPAIPYYPSTRLFRSPLYIQVPVVPEYRALCADGQEPPEFAQRLRDLCRGQIVDYPEVLRLKQDALRLAHAHLRLDAEGHARRQVLAAFTAAGGETLRRFAIFCAIQQVLTGTGERAHDSTCFPERLRDVASAEVARFAQEHESEVEFHVYLQFLLDEQLASCARLARERGMRVGLYLDLAVGSAHGGFDAWCFPSLYVSEASLGAPADALAPQGQDWGLVPLHPQRQLLDDCQHFRMLLRSNMRYAGAMRIDHAMGMARQFWIPRQTDASGTYVAFPARAMLDVLAQESCRARTVVVAEDLGTVPEGFREALHARGILRYQVLHFERDPDGEFLDVGALDRQALLCLSTHDVPTFGEFWRGADLLLRRDMGLLDEAALLAAVEARMRDKAAIGRWLARHSCAFDQHTDPEALLSLVHGVLARGPSVLVCLSLDDLCGEPHAVNVPGTTADQGFISFARRTRRSLEEITGDPRLSEAIRTALAALPHNH